ncbi:MAG: phosphopyruvate hydratase [Holosporales bacterium]|jgi:enolase|nr:phosphopyruvate hydratase [Holosporales bacterium]
MSIISKIIAREILDSRGYPTIETEVVLESGHSGVASVPSGASTGAFEAVEMRDNDPDRFRGKGVQKAIDGIMTDIEPLLVEESVLDQQAIDKALLKLDNTSNKSGLGANAILSVSMACALAAASFYNLPLYRYIGGIVNDRLPKPMMNIINGGVHADNKIDIQEFMIVPYNERCFEEYVAICAEVYHNLKDILKKDGLSTNVGDEGGFAPNLSSTKEALDYLMRAVEKSECRPGSDICFALDVAASELYENKFYKIDGMKKTSDGMIDFYKDLARQYPIISIEDPLHEEDWEGWANMNAELGKNMQIVGDDLYATNIGRLLEGIEKKAANAILIKPNQIGTLTETLETINCAKENGYNIVLSHRSGETSDSTIADIAVGVSAQYIKAGAPARGERVAKYNRLLKIEDEVLRIDFVDIGES